MRRLAPTAIFLACAGGLVYSAISFHPPAAPEPVRKAIAAPVAPPIQVVTVRGQVSSDKMAILSDPEMRRLMASQGLLVQAGQVPARDMLLPPAPETQYVFSWPSDDETATIITRRLPRNPWVRTITTPFYTSPVILTWAPAADALKRVGMVRGEGRWRTVDIRGMTQALVSGSRWSDVTKSGWTSERPFQLRMADLDRSGTATMFLSLASQIVNGGRNVTDTKQAGEIADRLVPVFQQGRQPATSSEAISEFVSFGISRTPLLLVSEADAIQLLSSSSARGDIVVLYPDETVVSPQSFVPYTLMGQRVGRVLDTPQGRRIGQRHGFRVPGSSTVPGTWSDPTSAPPASMQTILEMPDPGLVETMIDRITGRTSTAPPPAVVREPEEAPPPQDAQPQEPIRDPGEEAPPIRPIIDPDASATSQQAIVQDYIRRLGEYRTRQAARAAAAGARQ